MVSILIIVFKGLRICMRGELQCCLNMFRWLHSQNWMAQTWTFQHWGFILNSWDCYKIQIKDEVGRTGWTYKWLSRSNNFILHPYCCSHLSVSILQSMRPCRDENDHFKAGGFPRNLSYFTCTGVLAVRVNYYLRELSQGDNTFPPDATRPSDTKFQAPKIVAKMDCRQETCWQFRRQKIPGIIGYVAPEGASVRLKAREPNNMFTQQRWLLNYSVLWMQETSNSRIVSSWARLPATGFNCTLHFGFRSILMISHQISPWCSRWSERGVLCSACGSWLNHQWGDTYFATRYRVAIRARNLLARSSRRLAQGHGRSAR